MSADNKLIRKLYNSFYVTVYLYLSKRIVLCPIYIYTYN